MTAAFETLERRLALAGPDLLGPIPDAAVTADHEFRFDVGSFFDGQAPVSFSAAQDAVGLEHLADGFENPVQIVSADDGSGRIFIVEQTGQVKILRQGQAGADLAAPVVTNVFPSATDSDAIIAWTSDEPTTGYVEYGTTSSFGSVSAIDSRWSDYHRSLLPDLDAETEYFVRVVAMDAAGNTSTSQPISFVSQATVAAGEVLYNGIVLPQQWPPPPEATQAHRVAPYLVTPPDVIDIDVGRQLFVDDFLIQATSLTRRPHRPEFYDANPVIAPGDVHDFNHFAHVNSGGVWYDPADALFKTWYSGSQGNMVSYAYSSDGMNWIKPELPDSVDFPNSNTVLRTGSGFSSTTVWMDPLAQDPNRKYQLFAYTPPQKLSIWYSPDGIDWTKDTRSVPALADRSTMFYNPFRDVWVSSLRSHTTLEAVGDRDAYTARTRAYAESGDLNSFTPAQFWTGPDVLDPIYYHPHGERPELYNLDAVAYESVMVGLFTWWHGGVPYPGYEDAGPRVNELGVGFSRDGYHWDRPTRGVGDEAFIPASNKPDTWNGYNTQSAGGSFLVVGDELWFYFSGRSQKKPFFGDTATGLAKLRRDGFYSMDADAGGGTLTTRPLQFSGKHLFVNVDNPSGQLQVEILDVDGNVLAPFEKSRSIPVSADKTLVEMEWTGVTDLSALSNSPVRFRFHLTDGQLYSFWVSDTPAGASHGYVAAGGPGLTGTTDTVGRDGYVPSDDATGEHNERRITPLPAAPATVHPQPFLDLRPTVMDGFGRGLQAIAFHPDFAQSGTSGEGKLYVFYNAPATMGGDHDSVVSEFRVSSADADRVDPSSERVLLRWSQPAASGSGGAGGDGIPVDDSNLGRKGGSLSFDPNDGLLYIATDGGFSGQSQDLGSLLGKVLRIDVDGSNGPGGQYGIPATNPMIGIANARAEIYAYGLNHPSDLYFDGGQSVAPSDDRLFVTDTGLSGREEVNLVVGGGNYGWELVSGGVDVIVPIADYPRTGYGEGVVGGNVYDGAAVPRLDRRYLMGDTAGQLKTLSEEAGGWELQTIATLGDSLASVGSIGDDIYVATTNTVHRLVTQTSSLPRWLSLDPVTGTFSGTPGQGDVGTIQIDVVATDASGSSEPATFELTVESNHRTTVTIEATDALAVEASHDGELTISRWGDLFTPLTVYFSVSGTATAGDDYQDLGHWITIPIGQSSVSLPVQVIDDLQPETDETVVVTLTAGIGYELATARAAAVTISSNEQIPTVDIQVSEGPASEPSEGGSLVVSRTGGTSLPLTVHFTVGGTATSAADYDSIGTSVVIPVGAAQVNLPIHVTDDAHNEGVETVVVTLADDPSYQVGTFGQATLAIRDDDVASIDYGLVAHWRLDETGGDTAADQSGLGHDGQLDGDPQWTAGRVHGAIELDGVDDRVDAGLGAAIVGEGPFSVAAWVRTSASKEQVIVQQRSPQGYDGAYVLRLQSSGHAQFWTFGGSAFGPTVSSTLPLNDGLWHHVAGVREADGTMRLYIDGVLDASAAGTARPLATIRVFVGADGRDNSRFFDGMLDEVRVYDRAISPQDAEELASQIAMEVRAADDTFSVDEDHAIGLPAPGLMQNDQGAGILVTTVDAVSSLGVPVSASSDGSFQYDPTGRFDPLPSGQTLDDTFTYTISDGLTTDQATVTISIAGVNDPPSAAGDTASTDADSPVVISVLQGDSDIDSAVINVSAIDDSQSSGSVTLNADQTVTYDPNGQFDGLAAGETADDSFAYQISDGEGGFAWATVIVTVTGLGTSPATIEGLVAHWRLDEAAGTIAEDDSGNGYDALVGGDPVWSSGHLNGGLDFDGAGDHLNAGTGPSIVGTEGFSVAAWVRTNSTANQVVVQQRSPEQFNGEYQLQLTSGRVRFWTFGGYRYGPDVTSSQRIHDGQWHHVVGVREDDGTTKIYIDGVLDSAKAGAPRPLVPITVYLGGDMRGGLNYLNGSLDDVRIYQRALDAVEVDDLYRNVPSGDVLSAADDAYRIEDESANFSVAAPGVLENDLGISVTVTRFDATSGMGATVIGSNDGSFQYSATSPLDYLAQGETAVDTFAYTVTDGAELDTATVTITIVGQNDQPIAIADTASTSEDDATSFNVLANDSDADLMDQLRLLAIDDALTMGSVTWAPDGTVVYDPRDAFQSLPQGSSVADSFAYTVVDGFGGSSTASVSVSITGRNDPPVALPDAVTTDEQAAITIDVLANDMDADTGSTLSLAGVDTSGTVGTVRLDGNTVTYDPDGNFESLSLGQSATDSFTYTITDGSGGFQSAVVTVTVLGENDLPGATDDEASTDEDTAITINVLANDSDPDAADILSVDRINTSETVGNVSVNADGWITYDPAGQFQSLSGGETSSDSFAYTVTDSVGGFHSATVTVTIHGMDEAAFPTEGLLAYWALDDGSGSAAADGSGHGYTATLQADTAWTSGRVGGAVSFDGAGDHLDAGIGPAIVGTGGFTVSAWVRTDAARDQVIIQQRSRSDYNGEYQLHLMSSGRVRFWTFGGGYGPIVVSGQSVNDGQWHHIVGAREEDGTTKIYVDGSLQASKAGSPRTLIPIAVYIGGDMRGNTKFFDGSIDEVMIYDRAISSQEVILLADQAVAPVDGLMLIDRSVESIAASSRSDRDADLVLLNEPPAAAAPAGVQRFQALTATSSRRPPVEVTDTVLTDLERVDDLADTSVGLKLLNE